MVTATNTQVELRVAKQTWLIPIIMGAVKIEWKGTCLLYSEQTETAV